jgi:hypothetical protein
MTVKKTNFEVSRIFFILIKHISQHGKISLLPLLTVKTNYASTKNIKYIFVEITIPISVYYFINEILLLCNLLRC